MEPSHDSSWKMIFMLFGVLVLVQTPRTFGSEVLKHSKSCRTFHVDHLSEFGRELFFIDEKSVDIYFFCKALRYYHARHCFFARNLEDHYCRFDFTSGKLPCPGGRKCLKTVFRQEISGLDYGKTSQDGKDKYVEISMFHRKLLVMAIPVFFVISCALLCPCFHARKRETACTGLPKKSNSIDSPKINSMHEKFPDVSRRMPPTTPRVPPSPSKFSMSPKLSRLGSVHLNMNQAAKATNNFSRALRIGGGGFGTVYKAELPDGQVVAIKRARKQPLMALQTEFMSEIELLAKIDHRNLVKLLGYFEDGHERLVITEYVPNGTLREHLDGLKGKILDFNQRIEISIDVAHGLTFLHLYSEKQIIHRDIKSSNILLTESVRAKVADFGFARLGEDSEKSHVSTNVKGTVGYLDPEYMKTHKLTAKSDVYSFGILLLEILSGRRPVDLTRSPDERVTIRWAFKKYKEREYSGLLDPLMNETVDDEILDKILRLAIQCAAPTRADRPDMKAVGEQLWEIRMEYLQK